MLLSQQLTRLANEFALHTGTQVRFTTVGEEFEIPKQTKLSLIRCLQESLTNAKRHGRASSIEVTLTYSDGLVDIRIEDDGIGTEQLKVGFGINAMQERIFALQGYVAGKLLIRSRDCRPLFHSCQTLAVILKSFLLEAPNGTMWIQTQVTLSKPVFLAKNSSNALRPDFLAKNSKEDPMNTTPLKLLLVDDQDLIRESFTSYLIWILILMSLVWPRMVT